MGPGRGEPRSDELPLGPKSAGDLLALDYREPQLGPFLLARLDAADHVEQPLHGFGRAANGSRRLLERFANGYASANLEPFLSGQPQTLCPLLPHEKTSPIVTT